MRPLELEIEAFGPYLDRQAIDFRPLTGLYLICGETGSGKTMLLDAICFALYGKSSGGGRDHLELLRCQRAPDDVPTRLRLRFMHKGKEYIFSRELSVRRKRSGAVEYRTVHGALARQADGSFLPLLANPTEGRVNEAARQLLGLDLEQFLRVVLLPQGKFERFLVARSSEKEAILQSLFDVGPYAALAERLLQMAKKEGERVDSLQKEENELLSRHGAADTDELCALKNAAAQTQATGRAQLEALTQQERGAREALAQARALADSFARQAQAREALSALLEQQSDVLRQKERLGLALRADKAQPALEAALSLRRRTEDNALARTAAKKAFTAAAQADADAQETLRAHRQAEGEQRLRQQDLARLQSLRPDYANLNDAQKAQTAAKAAYAALQAAQERAAQASEQAALALSQARKERDRLQARYLAPFEELRARKEQSQSYAAALKAYDEALRRAHSRGETLLAAQAARDRAQAVLLACREEARTQLDLYLSNAAGALAGQLQSGQACPVCGSREHPCPHAAAGRNNQAALRQAQARQKEAEAEDARQAELLSAARLQSEQAGRELDGAKAALAALPALTDMQQQEALAAFEEAVQAQAAYRTLCDERLPQLEQAQAGAQQAERKAGAQAQTAQSELARAKEALRLIEKRLDPAIGDLSALDAEIKALEEAAEQYRREDLRLQGRLVEASSAARAAERELKRLQEEESALVSERKTAEDALAEALVVCGFADEEALRAAILPTAQRSELQDRVGRYEYDLEYRRQELARLGEQLRGQTLPDLAQLSSQAQESERLLQEMNDRYIEQRLVSAQLEKDAQRGAALHAQCLESRRVFQKMDRFARTLRGERGVGLTRFALNVMLNSVCGRANELLRLVHGGRYALTPTLEGDGRSKRGLELMVLDALSGRAREVESLSGGEKFLVSLALSIALKTVVQSLAGGAAVEAMFIDEGFGSLDTASVQEALQLLLLSGDKTQAVGIISHVQALRESLSSRIEVISEGGLSHAYVRA